MADWSDVADSATMGGDNAMLDYILDKKYESYDRTIRDRPEISYGKNVLGEVKNLKSLLTENDKISKTAEDRVVEAFKNKGEGESKFPNLPDNGEAPEESA